MDLLDHFFRAHVIGTGLLRDVCALALGDDENFFALARAVGEHEHAADLLVCLAGIDAQAHVQFDGFVELRLGGVDGKAHGFVDVVCFGTVVCLQTFGIFFPVFHSILPPCGCNERNSLPLSP